MTVPPVLFYVLLALAALSLIALLVLLFRSVSQRALAAHRAELEQSLREEQRLARAELDQRLHALGHAQGQRIDGFASRLDQFGQRHEGSMRQLQQQSLDNARRDREESAATLKRFGDLLHASLAQLGERNEQRLTDLRGTLESQLKSLQTDNAAQLDKMRATVDEKLQSTLETRLGQSFKLVSERLEQVQRGLGEMQTLAKGVGDLNRVLTNVKSRGTFGEVQLGRLLEDMLAPEQFGRNVDVVAGSGERVEFALRMPGRDAGQSVWMPIDAKFPREDYERLLDAQDRADAAAAQVAGAALERRLREEAKTIRKKYIAPPATTDFAILFLPTEGLYAEAIRRDGLFEALQREHRVTLAGPTTLTAIINALQMGFRTLAIEQRSSEVWQLLGAVKNEFGKFGDILDKTRKQLDSARNNLDELSGKRSRAIERKLRSVESLDNDSSQRLLGDASDDDDG
ncbi:MAG TPA: DNA recombination protein RmuC [Rhodanobacteraceae bacterium]|nr:DNA recombination protein RmuC [Rhodanobacteraceae bacterium]